MIRANLNLLPIGKSDFSLLRSKGQVYVDKTSLIHDLASGDEKILFTRPRRFGKSLLLSTFESLFKYGLRDFRGLEIEKLWSDNGSYHVLKLDFSTIRAFSSRSEFHHKLIRIISDSFILESIEYSCSSLYDFSLWLKQQKPGSVVLLIDEYDAPLTQTLSKPELLEEVKEELTEFYSVIKSNDRAFRFVFITGITKFNRLNVFSALNHLTDISLYPDYGCILG